MTKTMRGLADPEYRAKLKMRILAALGVVEEACISEATFRALELASEDTVKVISLCPLTRQYCIKRQRRLT
jgi:hypothetical protein